MFCSDPKHMQQSSTFYIDFSFWNVKQKGVLFKIISV